MQRHTQSFRAHLLPCWEVPTDRIRRCRLVLRQAAGLEIKIQDTVLDLVDTVRWAEPTPETEVVRLSVEEAPSIGNQLSTIAYDRREGRTINFGAASSREKSARRGSTEVLAVKYSHQNRRSGPARASQTSASPAWTPPLFSYVREGELSANIWELGSFAFIPIHIVDNAIGADDVAENDAPAATPTYLRTMQPRHWQWGRCLTSSSR
jgi:hypothetical protein